MSDPEDMRNVPLLELFRAEVDAQAAAMTAALLAFERDESVAQHHEEAMRGAHSVKGAARIVNREAAARLAHCMEECFVTAQRQNAPLSRSRIDELLRGVDLLRQIAHTSDEELAEWEAQHRDELERLGRSFCGAASPAPPSSPAAPTRFEDDAGLQTELAAAVPIRAEPPATKRAVRPASEGQAMRITAANLDRLLGLAGESVVAARWLDGFAAELHRLKRQQHEIGTVLGAIRESLAETSINERLQEQVSELQKKAGAAREVLDARLQELESFDRRFMNLSERLHHEVLDCRMRPFADGTRGLPRITRDAARALGKEARLVIAGESVPVDREILARIESPLGHLLRNAIDHGIEPPEERERLGKSREGIIRVEARHGGGALLIDVTDDGRGIDLEQLRSAVVRKGLTTDEVAAKLGDAELLEFIFLPGFTMKETVTQISGRGVGLDVVNTAVRESGGTARVSSKVGRGTVIQLRLPLTLSVLRALLAEIAGEPYAFPLGRIASALKVPRDKIESIEGKEHFTFAGQPIGIVTARQVLGFGDSPPAEGELPIIVLGDKTSQYGVVVDRFLGERELVVRALDPRLGKVQDISAAALLPDQTPALIIDVDDLLRSIENVVSGGRIVHVRHGAAIAPATARKRVLVVDDSLTVRELERKLIGSRGYEVEVAVDGMDGWNAARAGHYDLIVTDIDMPRLDGIELVSLIKKDPRLHRLPVMIVSYKDREEDRRRGLEAGADYYLTKGSFHDETLLQAVVDLIGEPEE